MKCKKCKLIFNRCWRSSFCLSMFNKQSLNKFSRTFPFFFINKTKSWDQAYFGTLSWKTNVMRKWS